MSLRWTSLTPSGTLHPTERGAAHLFLSNVQPEMRTLPVLVVAEIAPPRATNPVERHELFRNVTPTNRPVPCRPPATTLHQSRSPGTSVLTARMYEPGPHRDGTRHLPS
jgi:hypothetical protein